MNKAEQHRITLEALVKHQSKTSLEIHNYTGIERHLLARRLPELEEMGLAKREPKKRACRASKTAHISFVWIPTYEGIVTVRNHKKAAYTA